MLRSAIGRASTAGKRLPVAASPGNPGPLRTHPARCRRASKFEHRCRRISLLPHHPTATYFLTTSSIKLVMPTVAPTATWQELAAAKKARQEALIPAALRLKAPPGPEVLDVTGFAFNTVLSARDIEITSTPTVGFLLDKLQSGTWTAVEVTRAFCNRALVAQQLVSGSLSKMPHPTPVLTHRPPVGQLPDRDHGRRRARARQRAGRGVRQVWPGRPPPVSNSGYNLRRLPAPRKLTLARLLSSVACSGLPISLKDQICIKGLDTTSKSFRSIPAVSPAANAFTLASRSGLVSPQTQTLPFRSAADPLPYRAASAGSASPPERTPRSSTSSSPRARWRTSARTCRRR